MPQTYCPGRLRGSGTAGRKLCVPAAVCGIPTNTLNKTFATFKGGLKKDRYLESIQASFLLLQSYRRFPTDDEFKRELQTKDLYNFRSRSYWLRRLENYGRRERVAIDEYTIEHIMPQNEKLSAAWRTELVRSGNGIHQTYLHTLGNLTLTGYNSDYCDKPLPTSGIYQNAASRPAHCA